MWEKSFFEQIRTPAYVYHKETIISNYKALAEAVSPLGTVFYSMKANPEKNICRLINNLGAGIEVASAGELSIVQGAGIDTDSVIFTGPGKTVEELKYAIDSGAGYINVESAEELKIVDFLAKEKGRVVKALVRINPSCNLSGGKITMSGVPSQFGVEEELTDDFFEETRNLKNVIVSGFHIYVGTQILSAEEIVKNTDYALSLFIRLTKKYQLQSEIYDVGGGFGVKYFPNENNLDLVELKQQLKMLHEKYRNELEGINVVFESGRFIVASAGEFITRVLYVKNSKGTKFVICDGGSNLHSSAAFLGRFVRGNFPLASFPRGEEEECATVTGPLCTALDVIGQKVSINKHIGRGDYIMILMSGAYGMTYSPVLFLSHECALQYMEEGGNLTLLS